LYQKNIVADQKNMAIQSTKASRTFLQIGTITGWFAVVFQFYLIIINRVASVPETIIRFFSFFTILTNMLVALCFIFLLLKPKPNWGKFFSRPKTLTAITVYISIVGIVYNTILRHIWNPKGLQLIVDELLHSVIPVFFILYWLIFVPKAELQWKNVFPCLIYPVVYILFVLFRGALSGFYPYPFINVNSLGFNKVLLNSGGLLIVFLGLSLLFVAIGKIISRNSRS
jgi:hypothetical protein